MRAAAWGLATNSTLWAIKFEAQGFADGDTSAADRHLLPARLDLECEMKGLTFELTAFPPWNWPTSERGEAHPNPFWAGQMRLLGHMGTGEDSPRIRDSRSYGVPTAG